MEAPAEIKQEIRSRADPKDLEKLEKENIFHVTDKNGFLSMPEGLRQLPEKYTALEKLMTNMPALIRSDDPDAVAKAVQELPEYNVAEDAGDARLIQSLYRDLSVLTAGYLIEGKQKTGKPRTTVPKQLSVPFETVAALLDEKQIMGYDSYALCNTYSVCPDDELNRTNWENLRMIRAFDGGPEEATFTPVHIEMEAHMPQLVKGYNILEPALDKGDKNGVHQGLDTIREGLEKTIVAELKMFNGCEPKNYETHVRPWIFGYVGNPDFPDGVYFEGAKNPGPMKLRGETGAQSTIIPSLDAVLGIEHKKDALRDMLQDLESYRPKPHREYLCYLRNKFYKEGGFTDDPNSVQNALRGKEDTTSEESVNQRHRLRDFIIQSGDRELAKLFNECVRNVYYFRAIHVVYADMYIARYTDFGTATGGTPYKAYLRKHRDESIAQQISLGDEDVLRKPETGKYDRSGKPFEMPSTEDAKAQLEEAEAGDNCIPRFLLDLHHDFIERHGRNHPSLSKKMYQLADQMSYVKERLNK
eukprot:gb/GECG01015763.1/.p1 GENE.gb/GECG01015763.1/~~gb/GECG01015763.1/.p1  ORF type:complete len:529 (+),score=93.67 gb/GECG01015763.1/:1-1587(+)